MKKSIIVITLLLVLTLVFAEEKILSATPRQISQANQSRTEVVYWQENFESGAPGWTFSSTLGSNIWHIAEVADAPSPINAMINQNAQSSYNPSMQNYITSPSIMLPLSGAIKASFMMNGSFTDNSPTSGGLSVLDYWGWEISPNNGTTWYRMSNPYNSPTGNNYVFIDCPDTWTYVTDFYGTSLDGLITDYAGLTVKFRIYFRADSDTPIGPGIMIDNFTIFNDVFIPSPSNLTANLTNQSVQLNWTAPPSGFSTQTITSTNSAWTSFVSDADAYAMKIVNPLAAPLPLYAVKFMLYRQNNAAISGTPTIHVFQDAAGSPGNEILNVPGITGISNTQWKTVDISSHNIIIPASGAIFVGISNIDPGGANAQGLLCDSTSVDAFSFALTEGAWDPLGVTYNGLKNCALGGVYLVDDPFAPTLTGFKVYRSTGITEPYTQIGTVTNPTIVTYTDDSPVAGYINYYKVTGVFQDYESDPSEVVFIDLISLLYSEISYDDGTSDQNYNVGVSNTMATKFVTNPNAELHYVKIYLNSVGSSPMVIRIFDDNGTNGIPGTQMLQIQAAINTLNVGWNTIPLPIANIYTDPNGIFYIAVYEFGVVSVFGLDTNSSGSSWKKIGTAGAWTQVTEGNVMFRALVTWENANDDNTEFAPISNLSTYPNPFNQSTKISFEIVKAGSASLNIYNLKGQLVRSLSVGNAAKGINNFTWDGTDNKGKAVGLGVYFCKLEADGKTLTRKLVRIK